MPEIWITNKVFDLHSMSDRIVEGETVNISHPSRFITKMMNNDLSLDNDNEEMQFIYKPG